MGKARRVFNVLTGLFVILFGLFMFSGQDQAYKAMLFFLEDPHDIALPHLEVFFLVVLFLKAVPLPAKILHSIDHLAERMPVVTGVVFYNDFVISPCRQVSVAHKTIIGQMPRPAISEIHYASLIVLVYRVSVLVLFKIIVGGRVVPKDDASIIGTLRLTL